MAESIFATMLPIMRETLEGFGVTSDVEVRLATGTASGAAGRREFAGAKTVAAYVEEIAAEQWSWSLRAWTEEMPKRMTKVTFLEQIEIVYGSQVKVPGEPWRQVKDWRIDGKAVTSCVIA